MGPEGRALGQEGGEAFVGVVGLHQSIEVQAFDAGQAAANVALHLSARGRQCAAQCGGAAVLQVLLEPGERSRLGVVGERLHETGGQGFAGAH